MTSPEPALLELARTFAIATSFTDWQGRDLEISAETIRAVLTAMGVDADDPAAALEERERRTRSRLLPPCVVLREGQTVSVLVRLQQGEQFDLTLTLETGGTQRLLPPEVPESGAGRLGDVEVPLPPDLPLGYHTLSARAGDRTAESTIIVTPRWLGLPERLGDRSVWGFATQLYSVRSQQSWGVGDVADLTDLAVWSGAELGAGYVLVNPLHAAEPVAPLEPSPYLPSSRRFFNPLYLRVEEVPEYAQLDQDTRARVDKLARAVREELAGKDLIDRDTAWTAKRAALWAIHQVRRRAGREVDFRAYKRRQGEALRRFAAWNVIAIEHGNDYRSWPAPLQDVHSPEVARYVEAHEADLDFEMWLQWVLDEQLQRAQAKAVGAGMALGVMHDLAVGVHPGGADAWRNRDVYATGIHVGAPPDPYSQVGQDWNQPPWRPDKLQELAYRPFRELIADVLKHAGGVRIDHIMGLFRLWWVPADRPATEGTYVEYDHEALVGILALEAQRAGAVVVGEDLGVVPPFARDYLRERGILGTSILWFERDGSGAPIPAEQWRELCLASVNTHDLPPTAGYLAGEHVELRGRLGLLTRSVEEEAEADEADRNRWLDELRGRGMLDAGAGIDETIAALHTYLALAPSRLLGVALVDAVGDRRTQNQPGTDDSQYPNWKIPLSGPDQRPMLLEDVFRSERARAVARAVSREWTLSGD
ncbi:4-alpha-glucanotransferase [Naasia sp. SYSU D00948]|uniref:4-alpha-glucanotransferase n=1 Tax=Naasia sp. SYSU D00948 TaxID=2817379 RepID=UPI001B3149CC|nr:4-alpha-glucanotransferase [Naasia sp. SYSU D00948]